jgi:hypothetical protein
MAKSFSEELREHLEQVKNPLLFFMVMFGTFLVIAVLTLTGVYFYVRY